MNIKNKENFIEFMNEEATKDNVYKVDGQYIITGKGDSWNEVKNEIEEIYYSWIRVCGNNENEIIKRLNQSEIIKTIENEKECFYFENTDGIVGQPIIIDPYDLEQKTNLILLLLFISSKLNDDKKEYIRKYSKNLKNE